MSESFFSKVAGFRLETLDPPEVLFKKRGSEKFRRILKKIIVPEPLF